jgi:murein L,D-transpeptidase YafK
VLSDELKTVDRVVIVKSKRTMQLFEGKVEIASFEVSLGRSPEGSKECDGDNKTPEGLFRVTEHKADSTYYRSLRLSYPELVNTEAAKTKGCLPGSDIMIHGIRNGFGWIGRFHRILDWTRGCIAVTNEEIEKIWVLVPDGATVEIKA